LWVMMGQSGFVIWNTLESDMLILKCTKDSWNKNMISFMP